MLIGSCNGPLMRVVRAVGHVYNEGKVKSSKRISLVTSDNKHTKTLRQISQVLLRSEDRDSFSKEVDRVHEHCDSFDGNFICKKDLN